MVFEACLTRRAVFVTLAGGYARRVEDTVDIHVGTVIEAEGLGSSAALGRQPGVGKACAS